MTNEQIERLAASYLGRCRAIARKLTLRKPWEFDEAHSVAVAGLAEAIRTFDEGRGRGEWGERFARHLDRTVGSRVLDYLRSIVPGGYKTNALRAGDEAERGAVPQLLATSSLPDGLPPIPSDGPPVGWAIEWEDFVIAAALRLPSRHGEMIRWRYLHADAESLEGVARRMGLKVPRVVQLHREAMEMLRKSYWRKGA